MRALSDYGKFTQRAQTTLVNVSNAPGFDPSDWRTPNHRYGNVLQMIREGRTDDEISSKWPGVEGDVLQVYHLIADGKTCEMPREFDPEAEKKLRDKKKRQFMEAYRRRYHGKSRGV